MMEYIYCFDVNVLDGAHMEVPSVLYQTSLTRVGSTPRESQELSLAITVVHYTRFLVNPSGMFVGVY